MARTLKQGHEGGDVKRLQQLVNRHLRRWRVPQIGEDGDLGPNTWLWSRRVSYGLGIHRADWENGITPRAVGRMAGDIKPDRLERAAVAARAAWRARLKRRYAGAKPRIVPWSQSGLRPRADFGALGPETRTTTHYAASPRARNLAEGIRLSRQFDAFHRGKGWGGVSYHYLIPDTGELILGRSTLHKGAHVLNTNSNNIGINFFCTQGHRPTEAQKRTARWLIGHAHTRALPQRHRTDRDLRKADIRGHRFWPGQSTGCPGHFTPQNLGIR